MPAGIAATPSDAPVGQTKKGSAGNVATIPFVRASKWHIEQSNQQSNIALTAAQQTFNFPIASYGFLSALLITCVATGGTGTVAVAYEDAPWSTFASVLFQDVNGAPIWQLSGWESYIASKYGGYRLFPPDGYGASGSPANAVSELALYTYQAVQTSGNFKFLLPLFFEFGVGGLGCLPNMDASARYNLQLVVAAAGTASSTGPVYTTLPTTLPTMSITIEILARSQPPATDMFGNTNSVAPPAVGTVSYWTKQTVTQQLGANTPQLTRVGNIIRGHIFVWRNANGTRATAETGGDVPSVFEFDWDVGQRYVANIATLRHIFGYAAFGMDFPNGVMGLMDTTDPDKLGIAEYGDEWMATVGATKLVLRYTTTAGGGALSVLCNDIVPASGQVYQAPALVVG